MNGAKVTVTHKPLDDQKMTFIPYDQGEGKVIPEGSTVAVQFVARRKDGTVFDSS